MDVKDVAEGLKLKKFAFGKNTTSILEVMRLTVMFATQSPARYHVPALSE